MSETQQQRVNIVIQGKTHQLVCPPDKQQALTDAAELLNQKLSQVTSRSNVNSNERALLMAALNLAHELLDAQSEQQQANQQLSLLISKLRQLDD